MRPLTLFLTFLVGLAVILVAYYAFSIAYSAITYAGTAIDNATQQLNSTLPYASQFQVSYVDWSQYADYALATLANPTTWAVILIFVLAVMLMYNRRR